MKFKRILSIFLMLSILILSSSCSFLNVSSSVKVETVISDYLNNKYPDLEFEIGSYTQDTYTSGRYVFNVYCKTTSVEFTVYHSSFLTTDSYSVVYANYAMEKSLLSILGEEFCELYVNNIQWKNLYADGSDGYRFRTMELEKIPYAVSEVSEIYGFVLKNGTNETEVTVAQIMKEAVSKFSAAGIQLEKIVFQFAIGKDTVLLTTDAYTVQTATEEELDLLLLHIEEAQTTDEIVEIVFGSDIKKAEYFLKDSEEQPDQDITETTESNQQSEKLA